MAFYKTFAPLDGKAASSQVTRPILGIVWQGDISGRNAEDLMSCYAKAMQDPVYRDCKKFTFYADKCSAQKNNWTIYTAMVSEVNRTRRPEPPDVVTIKYLEKGHTFMSADSFHARSYEKN